MTNWYKIYSITQIILIILLLGGGFYFYNLIKDRMEIFEDPLNYVISTYELNSCSCGRENGEIFSFSEGKIQITKTGEPTLEKIDWEGLLDNQGE